jgi:ribosome-associated toxin RatA of RatAB toxin-antitoxin module
MPQVNRSALVSFSAEQMFNLVNDVERYPEFLPGCAATTVHESADNSMKASVEVSKAGIKKTFTTHNQLQQGSAIIMELVDGPFKLLRGGWHFTPLDDAACKVELKLDFEFSSKMVEMAFGRVFNDLVNNMVSAFTQRAKQVYA